MNQIRLEEAQVAAAANALLLAEPIELGQACLRLGGPLAFEVTPREHPCSSSACSPPMNRRSAESSLHALGRVLSPGGSSEGGKLDVRLIPRLAPMAQSDEEKESDRQMLEVCRALLAEEPSTVRASACQKLGQLGLPEAEEPLSRLLESDTEPALVREAARQALVDLETPRVSREALGGLRLRLTPEDKDTEPMEAITDRRGRAVFENVPGEGRARLAVVERLGQDWLLEVRWSQRGQPHIDVFITQVPSAVPDSVPILSARGHRYQPDVHGQPCTLPLDDYEVLHVSRRVGLDAQARQQRKVEPSLPALALSAAGATAEPTPTAQPKPYYVHLEDPRFLAEIAPAGVDAVKLYLFCNDASLEGKEVVVRLGDQAWKIRLEPFIRPEELGEADPHLRAFVEAPKVVFGKAKLDVPFAVTKETLLEVDVVQAIMTFAADRGDDGTESGSSGQIIGWWPSTDWSVVLAARKDDSPDALRAFGKLYEAYRPALVAFLRLKWGKTEDEASGLIQVFFQFLLEKNTLKHVDQPGCFRSWLLTCLKHFVYTLNKDRGTKRGGAQEHLPVGADADEGDVDPPHYDRTADQEYDRQFAVRFLELVMARLEQEYTAGGKAMLFQHLHSCLLDKKGDLSHAQVGRQLRMSEEAVSQAVSRLRERFRKVFDEELAKLVGSPTDTEAEIAAKVEAEERFLFAALRT